MRTVFKVTDLQLLDCAFRVARPSEVTDIRELLANMIWFTRTPTQLEKWKVFWEVMDSGDGSVRQENIGKVLKDASEVSKKVLY